MGDSYTVLYGKYQRALIAIRNLEQQNELYRNDMENVRSEQKQIEKNIRTLCETILKKDKELKNEKNDVWFRMKLLEMISTAQESLERYFPNMEGLMKDLLKANENRRDYIKTLEKQIADQESAWEKKYQNMITSKESLIIELRERLEQGDRNIAEVDELIDNAQAELVNLDMPLGDAYTVVEEVEDDIGQEVVDSIDSFYENGDIVLNIEKGPNVRLSESSNKKIQEKITDVKEYQEEKLNDYAEKLSKMQLMVLEIMGDTGKSEFASLYEEAKIRKPDIKSESSVRVALYGLCKTVHKTVQKEKVIESIKCPAPGSANLILYYLTDLGKQLYYYIFSKTASIAEMELIKNHHSSLEHGYGIVKTAQMIQNMEYIKKNNAELIYLTRRKDYSVQISDNSSYIPDIVIVFKKNGKEQKRYIEYETGKCTGLSFITKCNKIANFSRYLNFIVPNIEIKELLNNEIKKWRDMIVEPGKFPGKGTIHIRIATFSELQNGNSKYNMPWPPETTISQPKNR